MRKIALSMGDPAGIGAEVILKALPEVAGPTTYTFYIFGDASTFYETGRVTGVTFDLPVISLEAFRRQLPGLTCLVDFGNIPGKIRFGQESAEYGKASMEYVEEAVFQCMAGRLDALVTGPISKKAINLAGYHFPGHTEFLAEMTHSPGYLMSFYSSGIWTVLSTIHLPLSEAIKQVKKEHLVVIIRRALDKLGSIVAQPSLGVASLNPHCAEGGLFGMEESMEIIPAVAECRAEGLPVAGPFPADTIYLRAMSGEFNIVVAHYHDQGMIPVKLLSFGKAVNVTLGLPFPRTSVDHGTAFDIAGKGRASAESMQEAIRLAIELLDRRDGIAS